MAWATSIEGAAHAGLGNYETAERMLRDSYEILQNHPNAAYLWASNGLNRGSVAVEFVGNFPNTRGKWWKGDKFGRHIPTKDQITAGRALVLIPDR